MSFLVRANIGAEHAFRNRIATDGNAKLLVDASNMKAIIVGGAPYGIVLACRIKEIDSNSTVVVIERGPSICMSMLPAKDMENGDADPGFADESYLQDLGIELRTFSEIRTIETEKRQVFIHDIEAKYSYTESYDALILSSNIAANDENFAWHENPGVLKCTTHDDISALVSKMQEQSPSKVIIVGGSLLCLRMAEALSKAHAVKDQVEILCSDSKVYGKLDQGKRTCLSLFWTIVLTWTFVDMAEMLHNQMRKAGVGVKLQETVCEIRGDIGSVEILSESGLVHCADFVILSVEYYSETELAQKAGVRIGHYGVMVSDRMESTQRSVWAMGRSAEQPDDVALSPREITYLRQAHIIADDIFHHENTIATSCMTESFQILGESIAVTGLNEEEAKLRNIAYQKVYITDSACAFSDISCYSLKVLFKEDGTIIGAQCIGNGDIAGLVDSFTVAIQGGQTVFDLESSELCEPDYHPINKVGSIASDSINKYCPLISWEKVLNLDCAERLRSSQTMDCILIDVREPDCYNQFHVPGSINLPLSSLDASLHHLEEESLMFVYCEDTALSCQATWILKKRKYNCFSVSGGLFSYHLLKESLPQKDLIFFGCECNCKGNTLKEGEIMLEKSL
eukprot:760302-Hanusia_phi.AAC.2